MSDDFRTVMRRYPTGVTVVTTIVDGTPKGFTATAFSSVSADPPMILICVNRRARTHPLISQAGHFAVNVLRLEQRAIAEAFAAGSGPSPFETVPYHIERSGSPIIEGALAYFDCILADEHVAGTHTVFIGNVVHSYGDAGTPLGYFDGDYRDFGMRIA